MSFITSCYWGHVWGLPRTNSQTFKHTQSSHGPWRAQPLDEGCWALTARPFPPQKGLPATPPHTARPITGSCPQGDQQSHLFWGHCLFFSGTHARVRPEMGSHPTPGTDGPAPGDLATQHPAGAQKAHPGSWVRKGLEGKPCGHRCPVHGSLASKGSERTDHRESLNSAQLSSSQGPQTILLMVTPINIPRASKCS